MRENRVKKVMREGEIAIVSHVGFADPAVVEIIALAGFDGAFINEHHFTYFSLNPSSTPLAAALIARTSRMKVGVIGHVLPLRHPVQ